MVNFFFWRRDGSSTASFEKTLSNLAVKIARNQSRLDGMRTRARRYKVLATMNLTFAYVVFFIVCILVVGYKNMGAYEWTGMASGPVLIYAVRKAITAYYGFRTDAVATRMKEQQEERAKTIQKLKDATKYDSTQELIEKYGGAGGKKPRDGEDGTDDEGRPKDPRAQDARRGSSGRLLMAPPSTANIQRPGSASGTPQMNQSPFQSPRAPQDSTFMEPGAEFAPNADYVPDAASQQPPRHAQPYDGFYAQSPVSTEHHWYDRVFDLLLGEDETAPKNRIVLICRSCRLVNGQAPPGTRALSEVGMWKCIACGTPNGEMDEGSRIVKEVLDSAAGEKGKLGSGEETSHAEEMAEVGVDSKDGDDGPAASVRKRRGQGKK